MSGIHGDLGIKMLPWNWKSREIVLKAKKNRYSDQRSVNFLDLDASCRCFGPLSVFFPSVDSHYDHHDWQSHTEHNTADGQLDWTNRVSWKSRWIFRIFKQKGRCEVQKRGAAVFCGVHLTPPLPVVVFPLEFYEQSDVAAIATNQLVPVRTGRSSEKQCIR